MNPEKAMGYTLGGYATVEGGPEIVRNAIGQWGLGSEEILNTPVGHELENTIDLSKEGANYVAPLFLVGIGLKTMFKGFENSKGKGRSGFAS